MTISATQPKFSDALDALDKTIEHDQQVLLPVESGGGRAYLKRPGQYYGDRIFFGNRGEEHYGRIKGLEASCKYKGGVYMGGAGIINLSYAAVMRSDAVILFDVNPHQKIFWNVFLSLLAEHEDKTKFEKAFRESLEEIRKKTYAAATNASLHQYFQGVTDPIRAGYTYKYGMPFAGDLPIITTLVRKPPAELIWYVDDKHYDYIHQLAKAGKIGALTLDVCDEISVARVVETLGDKRLTCLYVCNILNFFENNSDWTERTFDKTEPPSLEKAKRVLGQLLSDESLIISHDKIETAFWDKLVFPLVRDSNSNDREIVHIP